MKGFLLLSTSLLLYVQIKADDSNSCPKENDQNYCKWVGDHGKCCEYGCCGSYLDKCCEKDEKPPTIVWATNDFSGCF